MRASARAPNFFIMIKNFFTSTYIAQEGIPGYFTLAYNILKKFFKLLPDVFDFLASLPVILFETIILVLLFSLMNPLINLIDTTQDKMEELKTKLTSGKFKL